MTDKEEILKQFEDISQEKNRGILKRIVKAGNPTLKPFKKESCNVRYVGTYWGGDEDGKEFDRSDNFNFDLGTGNVIKAWDACVATMCYGEICELIASPENCYKDGKSMKFEIELFSSLGEDISEEKNGSIRKSVIEEGEGFINPAFGVDAKFSYKLFNDPNAKPIEMSYLTGDPEPNNVLPALDVAVRKMTLHEVAKIQLKSGDSSTVYEVKLISFEKLKHLSTFESFPEQMKYAETLKDRANSHLKVGKYKLAIETYKRLHGDLEYLVTNGPEENTSLEALRVVVHNNCALAYLKMNDNENAIKECEKATALDMKSEKAIFRTGQAYLQMNDHEEALKYFNKCAHFHQNNTDAMKMAKFCENKLNQAKQMERTRMRGIFNKLKDTGLGVQEPEPEQHSEAEASADDEESESEAASGTELKAECKEAA